MKRRIETCFESAARAGRKVLIPFLTAGDPEPEWTVGLMHALVEGGADLVELGIPFSDPMADGPVIQAASERAIGKGVDMDAVLQWVRRFRAEDDVTPVVLMGYMNPIERFGYGELAAACEAAGVDGLLIVDCPPEEMRELQRSLQARQVHTIRLVAPTTVDERLASIVSDAGGFIYYVSFKGITGAGHLDAATLAEPVRRIRDHTNLPVAVGFGIKDGKSAAAVAAWSEAVVIGSALVDHLATTTDARSAERSARAFIASIRESLDNMDR